MNALQHYFLLLLLCMTTVSAELQEEFQWENMNKNSFGLKGRGMTMDYAPDGLLYIGGDKYLYTWDGERIRTIDSVSGNINHLQFSANGELYVGGEFDSIGVEGKRVDVPNLAKRVGSTWEAIGVVNGEIYDFDFNATGELFAGGDCLFLNGEKTVPKDLAKWDGEKWSTVNCPSRSKILAVHCGSDGVLYAGSTGMWSGQIENDSGYTYIAMWDGEKWYAMGDDPIDNVVTEIDEDSKGNIYVCGYFSKGIAKWDGSIWTFIDESMTGGAGALYIDANDTVYIYDGEDSLENGKTVFNIRKYCNGTKKTEVGLHEYVRAMTKNNEGDLIVIGDFRKFTKPGEYVGIETHNILKVKDSVVTPFWNAIDKTVYKVTKSANGTIYIGGAFTHAGIEDVNHIAQWDDSTWKPVGAGVNGTVYDLQFSPSGLLTTAGEFSASGEVAASSIATWDGTKWSALGGGLWNGSDPGLVRAIAYDSQGNLYAAGEFTHAGETGALISVNNIAKWDGIAWSALGEGVDSTVYRLTLGNDNILYVGGAFSTAGEQVVNHVAMWNGTSWSAMGDGVDSLVRDVAIDNNGIVHIGGDFDKKIGDEFHKVLKWSGDQWLGVTESKLDTAVKNIYDLAFDEENRLWASAERGRFNNSILVLNEGVWTMHGVLKQWIRSILIDEEYVYIGGDFTSGRNDNFITRAVIPKIIPILPDFSIHIKGKGFDPHKAVSLFNIRGQQVGLFQNGLQLQQALQNKSLSSGFYFQKQGSLVQKLQIR